MLTHIVHEEYFPECVYKNNNEVLDSQGKMDNTTLVFNEH